MVLWANAEMINWFYLKFDGRLSMDCGEKCALKDLIFCMASVSSVKMGFPENVRVKH